MYRLEITRAIENLMKSKNTKRNIELILKFKDHCRARGLSDLRVIKYISSLKMLGELIEKDFDKATREDIERVVGEISSSKLSEWSKQNYKVALKLFYRWLYGLPKGRDPEITEWIKTTVKNNNLKLPEDMLSEEEVLKIIDAAPYARDKAIIATLWDTGIRIGELGTLRIKNVQFDDYGAVLIVKGKKGPRRVRAILAASYLSNWLNEHPLRDNPEAPLWVKISIEGDHGAMDYYALRKQIQTAVRRAGINKKIHPHLFRHSRATYMAKHLTEAQMKEYFGWTQGSEMAAIYVHLSGRDVDDALLKMHGLKKEELEGEEAQPTAVKCPRCKKVNAANAKFCFNCGTPLTLKVVMELEETRAELDEIKRVGMESGALDFEKGKIDWDKLFSNPEIQKRLSDLMEKKLEQMILKKLKNNYNI